MKNLFITAVLLVTSVMALAQGKTVYVSTEAIFANIPQSRVADSLINLQAEKLNFMYEDRKKELDELVEKFVIDSINMNAAQKDEKRKSLQSKYQGLGEYESELKRKLEDFKEKTYNPIRTKVLDVIRAVAKAKQATTVLYRESAVIIPTGSDITEEVARKMAAMK